MKRKTKYVLIFFLAIVFYTFMITQIIADIDCNLTRLVYGILGQTFLFLYFFPNSKKKKAK